MWFSIPSAVFTDCLKRARLAAESAPRLPILGTALFTVTPDGRTLEISTTDLDQTLTQRIPLEEPGGPGAACLTLAALYTVRPDKKTPVRIDYSPHVRAFQPNAPDAEILYVAGGMSARAPIECFPATEFPWPADLTLPGPADHATLLPGKTLAAIAASIPFQSKDETRYVLNGAFLDPATGVVATDGRVLAKFPCKVTPDPITLPSGACKTLAALGPASASASPVITTDTTTSFISIRTPGWTLLTKLITGNYPNWRQVIPTEFTASITLADAPGVAKWLASLKSDHAVHLSTRLPHHVDLTHRSGRITATAYIEGTPPDIAFSPRYLAAALAAAPGTLSLTDERSPGYLRTPTSQVVLMPMRITTETKTEAAEAAA